MTCQDETDKINIEKRLKIKSFAISEQIVASKNYNW